MEGRIVPNFIMWPILFKTVVSSSCAKRHGSGKTSVPFITIWWVIVSLALTVLKFGFLTSIHIHSKSENPELWSTAATLGLGLMVGRKQ